MAACSKGRQENDAHSAFNSGQPVVMHDTVMQVRGSEDILMLLSREGLCSSHRAVGTERARTAAV
jgi:hypothetical protein